MNDVPLPQILLAPVFALLLFFVWLMLDARLRGWRRIAGTFRATAGPSSDPTRQTLEVGSGGLLSFASFCSASTGTDGLWLAPPRALRWTHPPLFIPWEQLAVRDVQTRLGSRALRLSVGRIHLGFITLRGGVASDVFDRLKQ